MDGSNFRVAIFWSWMYNEMSYRIGLTPKASEYPLNDEDAESPDRLTSRMRNKHDRWATPATVLFQLPFSALNLTFMSYRLNDRITDDLFLSPSHDTSFAVLLQMHTRWRSRSTMNVHDSTVSHKQLETKSVSHELCPPRPHVLYWQIYISFLRYHRSL